MRLFVDLDGVLADFDSYATKLFGQPVSIANQINMIPAFWDTIHEHEDFYNRLPLLPDATRLYDAIKHLKPTILTGLPKLQGGNWADPQKRAWVSRHFGDIPVITCLSEDKYLHLAPGDILIDDWDKYKHLWESAGGIFIVHKSAEDTIAQLKALKVL